MGVGKPPFETQTLKETYKRIRANEYHVPSRIGLQAKNLIRQLLQDDPLKRPSVAKILQDDFIQAPHFLFDYGTPVRYQTPTNQAWTIARNQQRNRYFGTTIQCYQESSQYHPIARYLFPV